jgi:hypothetical protein
MELVENQPGSNPATHRPAHWLNVVALFVMAVLLAACGGGGGGDDIPGGGGTGGGGNTLDEALTFLEPDSFVNGREYETAAGIVDFVGGFVSTYGKTLDCSNPANFNAQPFLDVRWTNLATGSSGTASSGISCVDNGAGGYGVRARWLTDFIHLELGANTIRFDVLDNGMVVGRNSVTVFRRDVQGPSVSFVSPAPDGQDTATNAPVVVAFNKDMKESSLIASRLTVAAADGTSIAGVHSYDSSALTWKFVPTFPLTPGTTYTATVSADVEDPYRGVLGSDVQWQFTVGENADTTAPTIVATWPAGACQCSPPTTRIMLGADEPLDPAATISVIDSQDNPVAGTVVYHGHVLEFVPATALNPNEIYSVTADGLGDFVGNAASASTTWQFGTNDGVEHGSWEELAAPPVGLAGLVMASDDTSVFAFGTQGGTQFKGYYYQSSTDQWQALPDLLRSGATSPDPRLFPTVVWDGSELLVYGGFESETRPQDDGGAYRPATDTWRTLGGSWWDNVRGSYLALLGLGGHSAIRTGAEMLIWGGLYDNIGEDALTNRGWTYNPVNDSWDITGPAPTVDDNYRLLPDSSAPSPRRDHDAIWTGTEMIVWGGLDDLGNPLADGGRYDPATDTWQSLATLGAPAPAAITEAHWTGTEMLTWNGGQVTSSALAGEPMRQIHLRAYDPLTDSWRTPDSGWEPAFLPETLFVMMDSGSAAIAIGMDAGTPFPGMLAAWLYDVATDRWKTGARLSVPLCNIDGATLHLGQAYVSCGGHIYRFTP